MDLSDVGFSLGLPKQSEDSKRRLWAERPIPEKKKTDLDLCLVLMCTAYV